MLAWEWKDCSLMKGTGWRLKFVTFFHYGTGISSKHDHLKTPKRMMFTFYPNPKQANFGSVFGIFFPPKGRRRNKEQNRARTWGLARSVP